MQQRDLILREIEKIGVVVRAIISKMRGKEMDVREQEQAYVHHSSYLKDQLQFDIDYLLHSDMELLKGELTYDKGFTAENIELMGDMLSELSAISPAEDEILLQKRALDLYGLAVSMDKSFSFEREQKIDALKNKSEE